MAQGEKLSPARQQTCPSETAAAVRPQPGFPGWRRHRGPPAASGTRARPLRSWGGGPRGSSMRTHTGCHPPRWRTCLNGDIRHMPWVLLQLLLQRTWARARSAQREHCLSARCTGATARPRGRSGFWASIAPAGRPRASRCCPGRAQNELSGDVPGHRSTRCPEAGPGAWTRPLRPCCTRRPRTGFPVRDQTGARDLRSVKSPHARCAALRDPTGSVRTPNQGRSSCPRPRASPATKARRAEGAGGRHRAFRAEGHTRFENDLDTERMSFNFSF